MGQFLEYLIEADLKHQKAKAMNLRHKAYGYYEDPHGKEFIWDDNRQTFVEVEKESDNSDRLTLINKIVQKLKEKGFNVIGTRYKYTNPEGTVEYNGPAAKVERVKKQKLSEFELEVQKALSGINRQSYSFKGQKTEKDRLFQFIIPNETFKKETTKPKEKNKEKVK